MGPLSGSLLGGNATVARNPYLTRHFSRQNAVYCPFSKKERVFPDWSSLFRLFLGYFQIRNAIFVDFEERHTASVDVWVIFGSFSKEERHDLAKHRAFLASGMKGRCIPCLPSTRRVAVFMGTRFSSILKRGTRPRWTFGSFWVHFRRRNAMI